MLHGSVSGLVTFCVYGTTVPPNLSQECTLASWSCAPAPASLRLFLTQHPGRARASSTPLPDPLHPGSTPKRPDLDNILMQENRDIKNRNSMGTNFLGLWVSPTRAVTWGKGKNGTKPWPTERLLGVREKPGLASQKIRCQSSLCLSCAETRRKTAAG